jgi:hypothetical protein
VEREERAPAPHSRISEIRSKQSGLTDVAWIATRK